MRATASRARPARPETGGDDGPRVYGILVEATVLAEPQARGVPGPGSLEDTIRGLFPLSADPTVASTAGAEPTGGGAASGVAAGATSGETAAARIALKVAAPTLEEAARAGVKMLQEAAGRASAAFSLVLDVRELRIIPPGEMGRRFGAEEGWPRDFWERAGRPGGTA